MSSSNSGGAYASGKFMVKSVASGVGRAEGPVILQSRHPIVTSISNGCLYEIFGGSASVFAVTEGGPNGAAEWHDGRVFVAQLGPHLPAKLEPMVPGGIQVIDTDRSVRYLSLDPISPNDLCFGPDGYLYVTDPTRRPERNDGRIWKIDPASGSAELMVSVAWFPNGIAFGLEDDEIYVASTFEHVVYRMKILGDRLSAPEVAISIPYGEPDGMAFDVDGNLVVCAVNVDGGPSEVQVYDRVGKIIDRRRPGTSHLYTNIAIGADGTAVLADAANGLVLEIKEWARPGLPLHPFRTRT